MSDSNSDKICQQEPPVPAYVDLRSFARMDLDVSRMINSRASIVLPAEAFRAWFLLICQSWHQLPAASLPDDDRELTHLAGLGRDLDGWLEIRNDALYGWSLCSDGRWYHPVTAEMAMDAWTHKLRARHYRIPSKERPPFDKWRKEHEKELAAHVGGIATLPREYRGIIAKRSASMSRNVIRPDLTRPDLIRPDKGGGAGGGEDADASPKKTPPGSRLPDNWLPTQNDIANVIHHLHSMERVQHETDQFCDYWRAAEGRTAVKRDWSAAFRFWCRKAGADRPPADNGDKLSRSLAGFDRAIRELGG